MGAFHCHLSLPEGKARSDKRKKGRVFDDCFLDSLGSNISGIIKLQNLAGIKQCKCINVW